MLRVRKFGSQFDLALMQKSWSHKFKNQFKLLNSEKFDNNLEKKGKEKK